jgi:hypothetical protein
MHTLLFATQRLFSVMGMNPGTDSANIPSYAAGSARVLTFRWNAAEVTDLGSSNIVGQSNVPGTHPPR